MRSVSEIRAIAIGILIVRGHLLCVQGQDSVKRETFYRPLGGGNQFGERAADAVVREFAEEIQRRIEVVEYLGTVENIFTYEGEPGHQIVAEFCVRFASGEEPTDLYPLERSRVRRREVLGALAAAGGNPRRRVHSVSRWADPAPGAVAVGRADRGLMDRGSVVSPSAVRAYWMGGASMGAV